MSENPNVSVALGALLEVNKVDGFDPTPLAVDFTDSITGVSAKRLPVRVQIGWFRLKYPEGKIAVKARAVNNGFVAEAKVYADRKDPVEAYIAEGSASRGFDPNKPTVSPREWAQTAAIGVALKNAGFGVQYDAAGDSFGPAVISEMNPPAQSAPPMGGAPAQSQAALVPDGILSQPLQDDDLPWYSDSPPASPTAQAQQTQAYSPPPEQPQAQPVQPQNTPAAQMEFPPTPPQPQNATPADPAGDPCNMTVEQAMQLPCPVSSHKGKTLGQVAQQDPGCITWLAEKYTKDPKIVAGAKILCNHALDQAS